jgi:hypothetical protein
MSNLLSNATSQTKIQYVPTQERQPITCLVTPDCSLNGLKDKQWALAVAVQAEWKVAPT